jgi:hypothetical protein
MITSAFTRIFAAMGLHAPCVEIWDRCRHRCGRHRFLCPACLRFDAFRFACGTCGEELHRVLVYTGAIYRDDCPNCRLPLGLRKRGHVRPSPSPERVRAYCGHCTASCDRSLYHERQIRVLAALSSAELRSLDPAPFAPLLRSEKGFRVYDEGSRLTYLLFLDDLASLSPPPTPEHAAYDPRMIWLSGASVEPLELGATVDHLLQWPGWDEAERQTQAVWVGEETIPPAARRVLEARFGRVRYGVSVREFLSCARPLSRTRRVAPPDPSRAGPALPPLPPQRLAAGAASTRRTSARRRRDGGV